MKPIGPDCTEKHQTDSLYIVFTCAFGLIILLYWASIQFFFMLNGNVTWLLIAAERLINGETLLSSYYETNPPLSILIYTPFVFVAKITNIASPVITALLTYILALGSLLLTERILRRFEWLNTTDRLIFIGAFMVGITSVANVFFADREHLMVMAMMPFILCQYALGEKIKLPNTILIISLTIGTIAFLVKPHYGILPASILLFRAISQKRPSVIKDPDFLFLAIGLLCYLSILFLVFSDYLFIVFPDVIKLYLHGIPQNKIGRIVFPYFMAIFSLFIAESFLNDTDTKSRKFLLYLHFCTLLFLIPAYVQFKGYYNHMMPIIAFLLPALSLSVSLHLKRFLNQKTYKALPIILVILLTSVAIPLDTNFPKHTNIKTLPLGKYINENCPEPCTFFVLHSDIEIINPTAAYTEWTHGTRFPAYWFIPRISGSEYLRNNGFETQLSKEEIIHLKEKYTQFVSEDFKRYKPSLVLIGKDITIVNNKTFDFLEFFGQDKDFQKNFIEQYTKTDDFSFDQSIYFTGTSLQKTEIKAYDVYMRNDTL